MTAPPPVTVGLPVYNGEPYLAPALDSILAQSFGDLVLLVADNASTDGTEEIVRSYARGDSRVRYLPSAENRGAIWNYNRLVAECDSPFFKWAASDDLLAPTCVERCLETLRETAPEVVLAFPQTRLIGPDGSMIEDLDDRMDLHQRTAHGRIGHVVRNVVWGNLVFGLISTDALRRTRLHGKFPSSDWVFLAELSLQGQFRLVPEPLFFRRVHEKMSRQANQTSAEIAQFFDPTSDGNAHELRRVFREYVRAIHHVPLSRAERALCYGALVAAWAPRRLKIRTNLLGKLGRR